MKDSLSKSEIDSLFKEICGNYWKQVKRSDVIAKDFNFMSFKDACVFVDKIEAAESRLGLSPSKTKFKASLRALRHGTCSVPDPWGKVLVEIEACASNHFVLAKEIDEIYK